MGQLIYSSMFPWASYQQCKIALTSILYWAGISLGFFFGGICHLSLLELCSDYKQCQDIRLRAKVKPDSEQK